MTEPEQLTFDDVVESEPQPGDPEYTEWLRAGRPQLDVISPTTRVELD